MGADPSPGRHPPPFLRVSAKCLRILDLVQTRGHNEPMTNSVHRPVRSKLTGGYTYRGVSIMKRHGYWAFTRYNFFDGHRALDSWYDGMATLKWTVSYIDQLIDEGQIVNGNSLWSPEAIEYANRTK